MSTLVAAASPPAPKKKKKKARQQQAAAHPQADEERLLASHERAADINSALLRAWYVWAIIVELCLVAVLYAVSLVAWQDWVLLDRSLLIPAHLVLLWVIQIARSYPGWTYLLVTSMHGATLLLLVMDVTVLLLQSFNERWQDDFWQWLFLLLLTVCSVVRTGTMASINCARGVGS